MDDNNKYKKNDEIHKKIHGWKYSYNYQKTSYDQWIPWTPIRKMSRERLKCRCKVLVIDRSMC